MITVVYNFVIRPVNVINIIKQELQLIIQTKTVSGFVLKLFGVGLELESKNQTFFYTIIISSNRKKNLSNQSQYL